MIESDLLRDILVQYDMPDARVDLIRHNENMTYCIEEKYLLRIHKSKPGFNKSHFDNDVDTVKRHENELKYLMHLNIKGVYVQSPIKNIEDKLVTVLKDGTVATMLTWLPGRTLNKEDLTVQMGYELGKMLGRMHSGSEGFYAKEVIKYDQLLCWKLIKFLSAYYTNGKLDKIYFESMSRALELIGDKLRQSKSIILHSDLSLSNILLTDNGLVPIDFSLFGWSSPMMDFGSVFCFVDDEKCRKNIILGYEEIAEVTVLESEIAYYVSLQIILGIVLHLELWITEPWFSKRLPEWCCNNFDKLI